ncbi:MAG: hypothetical protein JWO46_2590 [Nocardioidaceae bacterium]|nr:hypothetical protein [Nocardioidaceae bacterium]
MSEKSESTSSWFAGRLPDAWFTEAATVTVDREEILVVGRIEAPSGSEDDEAACEGRITRFREETRGERMRIADEAQDRFGRKVSWGAACGGTTLVFTHVAAPVMTRLRQRERRVLDTLVEAGVAKSRSDAVGWCVRLVGEHEADWIRELHDALASVRETRGKGPESRRPA